MAIAFVADKMRPLLSAYRQAWKAAGHPGEGEVMIAFHMFCDRDGGRARAIAAPLIDNYLRSLVDAASDWLDGRTSQDYPGYDKVIAGLRASNAADQMESGAAWVGTPDEIAAHDRPDERGFRRLRARLAAGQLQPDAVRCWRWDRCGFSPAR